MEKICNKKDCIHFEICKEDQVRRLLCGTNVDHYTVTATEIYWKKIKSRAAKVRDASAYELDKLGAEIGIKRGDYSTDQYRLLVLYKIQEDLRRECGIPTPKHIQDKIQGVMDNDMDGILLRKVATPYKIIEEEVMDDMGNKTVVKKKVAKKAVSKGDPSKPGIGDIARAAIKAGKDFAATLEEVKKVHPDTKFSKACYVWYKDKV